MSPGIQHADPVTRQKSVRGFVYLLSSGVPSLFDESDSQHSGLWNTILTALPWFLQVLNEPIQNTRSLEIHSDAAFALRFISSMEKATFVIQAGAVPRLVQLFQSGISDLQIQAAWCLGNIASESSQCCTEVIQQFPPSLVLPHIQMATPSLRRAAVWLLRSLIEYPDVLEKHNALSNTVKKEIVNVICNVILHLARDKINAVKQSSLQGQSAASVVAPALISPWRLFEISTGKPSPNDVAVVRYLRPVDESRVEVVDVDVNFETGENMVFTAQISDLRPMPVVDESLSNDGNDSDEEDPELTEEVVLTLCDSCWSLVELTVFDQEMTEVIVASGVCNYIVELLYITQSAVVVSPVLRLLGNIVSGELSCCQAVIDAGLLSAMPVVLSNVSRSVREEACWILSNIAGGQEQQVTAMLHAPNVLAALVEQMSWAEYRVRREATWALCNIIVQSSADSILDLIGLGVLRSFCPLLDEWEDPMLEMVILETMENLLSKNPHEGRVVLEESGCLGKLEELCYDQNQDVSAMASSLIDTFFSSESNDHDESESIGPSIVSQNGLNSEGSSKAFNFRPVEQGVEFKF